MDEMTRLDPVKFIEETKATMDKTEEKRREKTRLQSEVKQAEKAVSSMDKSIADNIASVLKKKKEEIAAGYDEKLSVCQNQIKEWKAERAKAKADAVAVKIRKENASLEHENTELQQQIDQLYEENGIGVFAKKHVLVVLFFPKRLHDWLIVAAAAAIAFFLIPFLLIAAMGKTPLIVSFILFLYLCILFGGYLYVLHHRMLYHQQTHLQVENLKAMIKANKKQMESTAANIRKSQDETGYNLGIYDDRIAEIEGQIKEILAQRKAALEDFEKITRDEISKKIMEDNKTQTDALAEQLNQCRQQLKEASDELERLEAELKNEYESRLGKDLMYKQKLAGLTTFCQENPELSLEQAIDCYKSTKKQ